MTITRIEIPDRDAIYHEARSGGLGTAATYKACHADKSSKGRDRGSYYGGVCYLRHVHRELPRQEADWRDYTMEDVIAETLSTPMAIDELRYFRKAIPHHQRLKPNKSRELQDPHPNDLLDYPWDLVYEHPPRIFKRDWCNKRPEGGFAYVHQGAVWHLTKKACQLPEEHRKLLVMEEADKQRRKFERLKRLYDSDAIKEAEHKREPVPEDVRIAAWRRDGGKCVQCDSNERLEYDHIIAISKGGSNTVRNIQLLCEPCNRKKSDSI